MLLALLYGGFVGLSLGLTGGGGSIFAIPSLVYGLELDFRRAVAISLAVIGLTALYGAVLQWRKNAVLWRAGLILGVGGSLSVPYGTRLGRMLPDNISLLLFAALMTFIGIRMLRDSAAVSDVPNSWLTCERDSSGLPRFSWRCALKLLLAGAGTGILSGVFGVGGGFLLVPTVLLVTAVSIERAMGTALVAIFFISASGFASNYGSLIALDLQPATWFLGGAGLGMTLGTYVKSFIPSWALKKGFASMILVTAFYLVLRNV